MTKQSMKIDRKLISGGNDQGPMLAPIQSKQIKMRDEFMQNLQNQVSAMEGNAYNFV